MSNLFYYIKRLIYPPKCAACRKLTSADECLCPDCRDKWEEERKERCHRCGRVRRDCSCPISDASSRLFGVFHLAEYERDTVTTRLVYRIKDGPNEPVTKFLAGELYELLRDRADFNEALLTYVPRSRDAIRRYGSDQALLLGNTIGELAGKENLPLIVRKGNLQQKDMNFNQRYKNVRKSYFVNKEFSELIKDKRIFVVDDIITTGSTVSYIADLLLDEGAKSVSAVSVARRTTYK